MIFLSHASVWLGSHRVLLRLACRELEVKQNAKRRIPPIGDVGAGGEKYVYDGMFFKMARDHAIGVSLYGGDEFAMCVLPLGPGVPPSDGRSHVYFCT